jgi:hypothetical protein
MRRLVFGRHEWVCWILVLWLVPAAAAEPGDCFPDRRMSESPSKRHAVVYRREGDRHRLYLRRPGRRALERLGEFQRSACVLWSPSGTHFAVTDYLGSNVSAVEIVDSENPAERADVSDLLPDRVHELMSSSLHGYLAAVSWDQRGLAVRAWGDRELEPKSFDVKLTCTRGPSRWTCVTARGSG